MKILVLKTEDFPHTVSKEHIEEIKNVDSSFEVVDVLASDEEGIQKNLVDAEIIAGVPLALPTVYQHAKNLKFIQTFSAGADRVLTPEVKASDIIVGNVSGIHAIPIAEHVLGFILIFTRAFHESFRRQTKKEWNHQSHLTELRDKTILVVGLGRIGSEIARLLAATGAKVHAVDQPGKEKPEFLEQLYTTEQFAEALPEADFVVSILPHTKETEHLFDMEKFRMMKDSAIFINVGRGPVAHEEDLIEALQQKIIAGAALDVTEKEPLSQGSPLWDMENVFITPHHSGHSEKYMDRAIEYFCENLKAYSKGEALPHIVDKQKGY